MKDHRQAQCRTAISPRPGLLCRTPTRMTPSPGVLRDKTSDRRRRSEHRPPPSDSGSEDSAAKKMTKMSHITYRSSTIEVIGKTAHFERVLKTVALRNMSVDGHLAKILREVGVYGHTLEPKAIMDGLINNPQQMQISTCPI